MRCVKIADWLKQKWLLEFDGWWVWLGSLRLCCKNITIFLSMMLCWGSGSMMIPAKLHSWCLGYHAPRSLVERWWRHLSTELLQRCRWLCQPSKLLSHIESCLGHLLEHWWLHVFHLAGYDAERSCVQGRSPSALFSSLTFFFKRGFVLHDHDR